MTGRAAVEISADRGRGATTDLAQPWLLLGRLLVVLLALSQVVLFVIGIPYRYRALTTVCPEVEGCGPIYLTPLEAAAMPDWLTLDAYAVYHIALEIPLAVVALSVMALIFARLSHTRMGLVTALALTGFAFPGEVIPALATAVPLVTVLNQLVIGIGIVVLLLFIYLFPNGRIEQAWVRRLLPLLVGVVGVVSVLPLPFLMGIPWFPPIFLPIFFGSLLLPIVLQIVRYRVYATPAERQQVKWVLLGLAGLFLAFVIWFSIEPVTSPVPNGAPRLAWYLVGNALAIGASGLLPVTIAYSILRRRLWDLDVVINRALVYGSLTLTLAGIYLGTVVLVQQVLLRGRESPLVVAGSTLLIAALFSPLRRRIQRAIDRRFYRQKVDGQRALAEFAATARSQVDLDALTHELLRVVGDSVQPSHMGVWLRAERASREERR
jgi:hypothetical protein